MRFLVTVGTGAFDELVHWADASEIDCVIQYGAGSRPTNKPNFRFDDRFESLLGEFDIIITHAGAGTIYKLLADGRDIIVVPNPNRTDDHQFEIFKYVKNSGFALGLTVQELRTLSNKLEFNCINFRRFKRAYKPEKFQISEFLDFVR